MSAYRTPAKVVPITAARSYVAPEHPGALVERSIHGWVATCSRGGSLVTEVKIGPHAYRDLLEHLQSRLRYVGRNDLASDLLDRAPLMLATPTGMVRVLLEVPT